MLREAQFIDLGAIVHLYQQLTAEMATMAPETYRPLTSDNRQYFADYLQNDLARLFVTETAGTCACRFGSHWRQCGICSATFCPADRSLCDPCATASGIG